MDRALSCCILLLSVTSLACQGQSFSTVTGRNHPEVDWRVATTEHFEIMHPARLDRIAAQAAPIAEVAYDTLSANLDTTFTERIRVYLTDQDAITNGFAVPFGEGYTQIWVNMNDWAISFTGPSSWLRLVLTHELTHIFHFRITAGDFGILGRPFQRIPRTWTEGLAQYQAETWNAQRGERWLRAAVLDDALSYRDGQSLWNGRLLYASGHSQMRYFTQQYGDSTLTDILHHRKDAFFGLAEVHNFETAFEKVAGITHDEFYEEWRRDVNVYYNTLAGQLETLDSLRTDTLQIPGRYIRDVVYSPDTSRIAALVDLSPDRPVRRLYVIDRSTQERTLVAEGAIEPMLTWRPDGERIVFSRQTRAEHGSVVDDLFAVEADGGNERRLTYGRRTTAPTYGPEGERLAFVATTTGTANVHLLDLKTRESTSVTRYTGDVHITGLQWHPTEDTLAFSRVTADTGREIVLRDIDTNDATSITNPATDDRRPVWSPSGTQLAYTSLRDGVPNAFVYDPKSKSHRRATQLVRGASVHDWVPADSAFGADSTDVGSVEALVTTTTLSKRSDGAFRIRADRTARSVNPSIPGSYAAWTSKQPIRTVPTNLDSDSTLIEDRGAYDALAHVTNRFTFALPYFDIEHGEYGISGATSWAEPLGKHRIDASGSLSFTEPWTKSEIAARYQNRQLYPTIGLTMFSATSSGRYYGSEFVLQDRTGGALSIRWPLDWWVQPYISTSAAARLQYADVEPLRPGSVSAFDNLEPPRGGQQASLRLQLLRRRTPPYRHNNVHPLDGWGIRLRATGAGRILGGDTSFLRGDASGYYLIPSIGQHRIFLYGRLQAQTGAAFPQDYLGLSRYDAIDVPLPDGIPITIGDAERVRGYREYVLGNRVAFGSLEYRVPLLPSLRTQVLGIVELGHTTLSAFLDAGTVWTGTHLRDGVQQAGTGLELKNSLRLFGSRSFKLSHAIGVAQPTTKVGTRNDVSIYYRVQTALPF